MNIVVLNEQESQFVSGSVRHVCGNQYWEEYYSRCYYGPLNHELHYPIVGLAVGTVVDIALMATRDHSGVPYVGIASALVSLGAVIYRRFACYEP